MSLEGQDYTIYMGIVKSRFEEDKDYNKMHGISTRNILKQNLSKFLINKQISF